MNIVPIHPADLRAVWGKVRAGLDKMPTEDWIAEDVYHAIRSGESALYVAANEQGYAGFMVLRKIVSEFSRTPVMHVWLAHSATDTDVFEAGLEVIKAAAQHAGAQKVTFGSPRKGWSKRYPIASINYEVPL